MAVTRQATVPNPGVVLVDTKNGEYLSFTLEAAGPIAIFAFSSSVKGGLKKPADFKDHPAKVYEWVHLKDPAGIQRRELLDLLMAFLTSSSYRYLVEVRSKEDIATKTVLDFTFTADDPKDTASISFNVLTNQGAV